MDCVGVAKGSTAGGEAGTRSVTFGRLSVHKVEGARIFASM